MLPLARAAVHPLRVVSPRHPAIVASDLLASPVPVTASTPVSVARLKPEDFYLVRKLLRASPALHAYLLGALDQHGPALFHGAHHWLGLRIAGVLAGVAAFGRNVHIAWTPTDIAPPWSVLARFLLRDRPAALSTRALVGCDTVIGPLLQQLWRDAAGPTARFPHATPRHAVLPGCGGTAFIDRGPQVLMMLERSRLASDARTLALAPATRRDLGALMAADRAMIHEELDYDVAADNRHEFHETWCGRVDDRRAFVMRDESGQLEFKADIASLAGDVTLIAGVYTRPDVRGRGLARAGVGELCHLALRHAPRVALAVYEDNLPALRLYRGLGFEPVGRVRSVWFV